MLAHNVMMVSDALPSGSRNLLHFENNLYDELQQVNATFENGAPSFSTDPNDKEFGLYGCRTNTSTSIILPNSIIDFGTQDFTISGWLRPTSVALSRIAIANVFNTDAVAKQILQLYKLGDSGGNLQVAFEVQTSLSTYFTVSSGFDLPQTSMSFIKFGRKDANLFMIINGVAKTGGTPNIGSGIALKENTTEPIRLGSTGGTSYLACHDAYYDEWLVQLGYGDDSLVVPTAPY